ncbi:acyl carrier protein [Nocardioides dilutus]
MDANESAAITVDTVASVRDVLVRVLAIEDRADEIDASTPLLGELPELDSLAVVELAVALENAFQIEIADDAFTGEVFATVGSLAAFVAGELDNR